VITFGQATDGKLGGGRKWLIAPIAMLHTPQERGRKAGKPGKPAIRAAIDGVRALRRKRGTPNWVIRERLCASAN
jgi:hypothetical protein